MSLPFFIGVDILREGKEDKLEHDSYMRWIVGGYDKHISFDEFKHELRKASHKAPEIAQSAEEIFDKVRNILGG